MSHATDELFDRTVSDRIPSAPRWSVPRGEIRRIVARHHVGLSMADIDADIQHRAAKANCFARKSGAKPTFTAARIRACQAFARKCHGDNIALFLRVAKGC